MKVKKFLVVVIIAATLVLMPRWLIGTGLLGIEDAGRFFGTWLWESPITPVEYLAALALLSGVFALLRAKVRA